jgi:hypothetical protein
MLWRPSTGISRSETCERYNTYLVCDVSVLENDILNGPLQLQGSRVNDIRLGFSRRRFSLVYVIFSEDIRLLPQRDLPQRKEL